MASPQLTGPTGVIVRTVERLCPLCRSEDGHSEAGHLALVLRRTRPEPSAPPRPPAA